MQRGVRALVCPWLKLKSQPLPTPARTRLLQTSPLWVQRGLGAASGKQSPAPAPQKPAHGHRLR